MIRMFVLSPVLVLGLVSGCAASDPLSEAAVVGTLSSTETNTDVIVPPATATTNSCVQIDRPRIEYWSELPPEPGAPAPIDYYKVCVTQPDCSSICDGIDVVPSVYSWHGVIKCTKCT
jgi:hypothetical protein